MNDEPTVDDELEWLDGILLDCLECDGTGIFNEVFMCPQCGGAGTEYFYV